VRITYDPEADAAYIYLVSRIDAGGVAESVPFEGGYLSLGDIVLDFDKENRLLGIEILTASRLLPREVLAAAEQPGQKP
jgi:uncharacterized protein YuzE